MGPLVVLLPVAASLGVLVSVWKLVGGSAGPYSAPDLGRAAWGIFVGISVPYLTLSFYCPFAPCW